MKINGVTDTDPSKRKAFLGVSATCDVDAVTNPGINHGNFARHSRSAAPHHHAADDLLLTSHLRLAMANLTAVGDNRIKPSVDDEHQDPLSIQSTKATTTPFPAGFSTTAAAAAKAAAAAAADALPAQQDRVIAQITSVMVGATAFVNTL